MVRKTPIACDSYSKYTLSYINFNVLNVRSYLQVLLLPYKSHYPDINIRIIIKCGNCCSFYQFVWQKLQYKKTVPQQIALQ